MTSSNQERALDEECRVFTRYLTGQSPSEYVTRKYREGHRAIPFRVRGGEDAFDVALTLAARRGPIMARIADAYARRARPHGVLRQKLALLLAVLENAPDSYRPFTAGGTGPVRAWFAIGYSLVRFGCLLLLGVLVFGPVQLLLSGRRPAASAPA